MPLRHGAVYELIPSGAVRCALDLVEEGATADGSRLVAAARRGGLSQRWRVQAVHPRLLASFPSGGGSSCGSFGATPLCPSSPYSPPASACSAAPSQNDAVFVLYSGSVPESTLTACGWRNRGHPSDVQLWCDNPEKPARLFHVAAVDASPLRSCPDGDSPLSDVTGAPPAPVHADDTTAGAAIAVRIESVMFPGRFLQTVADTLPEGAAGEPEVAASPYTIRPSKVVLGELEDAVDGGGTDASFVWYAFEVADDPPPLHGETYELCMAGCDVLSPDTDDDNTNDGEVGGAGVVRQGPSRGDPWHVMFQGGETERAWRLDVRYAGKTDGARVQLFTRNCSAAQRWLLRKHAEPEVVPADPRAGVGEVATTPAVGVSIATSPVCSPLEPTGAAWSGWWTLTPRCAPAAALAMGPDAPADKPAALHRPLHIARINADTPLSSQLWRILPRSVAAGGGYCLVPRSVWDADAAAAAGTDAQNDGVRVASAAAGAYLSRGRVIPPDSGCAGGVLAVVPTSRYRLDDDASDGCGWGPVADLARGESCDAASTAGRRASSLEPTGITHHVAAAWGHTTRWFVQRSLMEELVEGSVYRIFSRAAKDYCVSHPDACGVCGRDATSPPGALSNETGDGQYEEQTGAEPRAAGRQEGKPEEEEEEEEENKMNGKKKTEDTRGEATGSSPAASDANRACLTRCGGAANDPLPRAPPRDTQLWRVGYVGQCAYFISLHDPLARLCHENVGGFDPAPGGGRATAHVTRSWQSRGYLWRVLEMKDGWVRVASVKHSLNLDVPNHAPAEPGTKLHLWTDHGGKNQQWKFKPVRIGADARPMLVVWATYHPLRPQDFAPLTAAGYEVLHVTTTKEAWAMISTRREEVAALISSQLSGGIHNGFLSGLELARRVKGLYNFTPQCPVLAFVSTNVTHAEALDVCDLFFCPALGDVTSTITESIAELLEERRRNPAAGRAQPHHHHHNHSTQASASASEPHRPTMTAVSLRSMNSTYTDPALGQQHAASENSTSGSQRFSIRGKVGEGGFGTVYKAFDHLTGSYVVVKEIALKSASSVQQVEQEIALLTTLKHPGIVEVVHVERHAAMAGVRIFMEWMAGGSLADVLREMGHRLHELTVRHYICQAAKGLAYLHASSVVHRDIKPGNLLVSGKVVKIADFGISIVAGDTTAKTTHNTAGTPVYLSPDAMHGRHSYASDIWALACTTVCLCSGKEPWSHIQVDNTFGVMLHIYSAQPPDHHPIIPEHVSPRLAELLQGMFAHDARQRPSAESLQNHAALDVDNLVTLEGIEALPDYTASFATQNAAASGVERVAAVASASFRSITLTTLGHTAMTSPTGALSMNAWGKPPREKDSQASSDGADVP